MHAALSLFGSGFLLSLSLCLDLGTVNAAAIRLELRSGARPAFLLGLGSGLGDLVYAALSAGGITLLLRFAAVRVALWLGGTVVLLGLAARMLREALATAAPQESALPAREDRSVTPGAAIGQGFALALSSPSAILWFASVGGAVLAAHAGDRAALLPFLLGFFCAGLAWSLAVAVARARHALGEGAVRWLHLASTLLFVILAVQVFGHGYRELVVGGR